MRGTGAMPTPYDTIPICEVCLKPVRNLKRAVMSESWEPGEFLVGEDQLEGDEWKTLLKNREDITYGWAHRRCAKRVCYPSQFRFGDWLSSIIEKLFTVTH